MSVYTHTYIHTSLTAKPNLMTIRSLSCSLCVYVCVCVCACVYIYIYTRTHTHTHTHTHTQNNDPPATLRKSPLPLHCS